jgi:Uma2 family endonuclease
VTSGLVDKLDIYRGLGVAEVWVWELEQFRIYHLRDDGYEQIQMSELLPDCDIPLLASYIKPEEQFDAVMAFREVLRSGRSQ